MTSDDQTNKKQAPETDHSTGGQELADAIAELGRRAGNPFGRSGEAQILAQAAEQLARARALLLYPQNYSD